LVVLIDFGEIWRISAGFERIGLASVKVIAYLSVVDAAVMDRCGK
jgi:hypothetical protein